MDRVSNVAVNFGDNSCASWITPSFAYMAAPNTIGDIHANILAMVGDAK